MTEDVVVILEDLENSIANENYMEFRRKFKNLLSTYDETRRSERRMVERAKVLSRDMPSSRLKGDLNNLDPVTGYLIESETLNLNRFGAITTIGLAIPNEEFEDLKSTVEDIKEREKALNESQKAAEDDINSADIGSLPRIYSVNQLDGPVVAPNKVSPELLVGNAGDEIAPDVNIRVNEPTSVSIPNTNITVKLKDNSSKLVGFEVNIDKHGDYQFSFVLEYEGEEYTEVEDLEVLSIEGALDRCESNLDDLKNRIQSSDVSKGSEQRLLSSINAAINSIHRAQEENENGSKKKVDEHIRSAINQMGAFLNKVSSSSSGNENGSDKGNGKNSSQGFSEKTLAAYASIAERIINLLYETRSAEP